jgi:hypothetical protein
MGSIEPPPAFAASPVPGNRGRGGWLACSRFHVHDVKTPTYSMSVLIAHFR